MNADLERAIALARSGNELPLTQWGLRLGYERLPDERNLAFVARVCTDIESKRVLTDREAWLIRQDFGRRLMAESQWIEHYRKTFVELAAHLGYELKDSRKSQSA